MKRDIIENGSNLGQAGVNILIPLRLERGSHYSDWLWSRDEEFSSWYLNMRLCRQAEENNWMTLDSENWIPV